MIRLKPARLPVRAALAALAALGILDRWAATRPARAAGPIQEQAGTAAPDGHDEDRAAIREAMQSFRAAFEARDAKALAAHWTAEGEYRNEAGETVQGRAALESAFSGVFERTPEVESELHPGSLRFLSADTAIDEGSVTVRRGPTGPATRSDYTALFVREEGRWLLAHLGEVPGEGTSVEDLAWIIGEWETLGGGGIEIRTTYSWAPSKKFILARFTIKEQELELSGAQVIGVDPATGELHTWTFEADGGVGEADWYADGDHWVLEAAGTLADGTTLVETNILRRVDDDTFTWQSIDRLLEDAELPDLAPVKVSRVKKVISSQLRPGVTHDTP